jgi:hypothetical protein
MVFVAASTFQKKSRTAINGNRPGFRKWKHSLSVAALSEFLRKERLFHSPAAGAILYRLIGRPYNLRRTQILVTPWKAQLFRRGSGTRSVSSVPFPD